VLKCTKVITFCCLGNMKEVERLLEKCTHIGKKRSQGYGKIKKITIEDTKDSWYCYNEKGETTRAIPICTTELSDLLKNGGFHAVRMGYKPPYWHPDNMTMCYKI